MSIDRSNLLERLHSKGKQHHAEARSAANLRRLAAEFGELLLRYTEKHPLREFARAEVSGKPVETSAVLRGGTESYLATAPRLERWTHGACACACACACTCCPVTVANRTKTIVHAVHAAKVARKHQPRISGASVGSMGSMASRASRASMYSLMNGDDGHRAPAAKPPPRNGSVHPPLGPPPASLRSMPSFASPTAAADDEQRGNPSGLKSKRSLSIRTDLPVVGPNTGSTPLPVSPVQAEDGESKSKPGGGGYAYFNSQIAGDTKRVNYRDSDESGSTDSDSDDTNDAASQGSPRGDDDSNAADDGGATPGSEADTQNATATVAATPKAKPGVPVHPRLAAALERADRLQSDYAASIDRRLEEERALLRSERQSRGMSRGTDIGLMSPGRRKAQPGKPLRLPTKPHQPGGAAMEVSDEDEGSSGSGYSTDTFDEDVGPEASTGTDGNPISPARNGPLSTGSGSPQRRRYRSGWHHRAEAKVRHIGGSRLDISTPVLRSRNRGPGLGLGRKLGPVRRQGASGSPVRSIGDSASPKDAPEDGRRRRRRSSTGSTAANDMLVVPRAAPRSPARSVQSNSTPNGVVLPRRRSVDRSVQSNSTPNGVVKPRRRSVGRSVLPSVKRSPVGLPDDGSPTPGVRRHREKVPENRRGSNPPDNGHPKPVAQRPVIVKASQPSSNASGSRRRGKRGGNSDSDTDTDSEGGKPRRYRKHGNPKMNERPWRQNQRRRGRSKAKAKRRRRRKGSTDEADGSQPRSNSRAPPIAGASKPQRREKRISGGFDRLLEANIHAESERDRRRREARERRLKARQERALAERQAARERAQQQRERRAAARDVRAAARRRVQEDDDDGEHSRARSKVVKKIRGKFDNLSLTRSNMPIKRRPLRYGVLGGLVARRVAVLTHRPVHACADTLWMMNCLLAWMMKPIMMAPISRNLRRQLVVQTLLSKPPNCTCIVHGAAVWDVQLAPRSHVLCAGSVRCQETAGTECLPICRGKWPKDMTMVATP